MSTARHFPPARHSWAGPLLALTVLLGGLADLGLRFPVEDAFHSGEFLAAAITILEGPPATATPYTLHGGGDYFPALFLHAVFPTESGDLIARTVIWYGVFSALTILFATLAALRLARSFGASLWPLIPFAAVAGAALTWRDLVFCLALYLFALVIPGPGAARRGRIPLQILFGAVVAFGAFWSYNRGLVTIGAFGPPMLVLAVMRRSHLAALASFAILFPAFAIALPGMSLAHYLDNLVMLAETSAKWALPFDANAGTDLAIVLIVNAAALILAARHAWRHSSDLPQILLLLGLGLADLSFMKIGLGRIDEPHVLMTLWLPVLILSLLVPLGAPVQLRWPVLAGAAVLLLAMLRDSLVLPVGTALVFFGLALPVARWRTGLAATAVALGLAAIALPAVKAAETAANGGLGWIARIGHLPADADAVTEGPAWAARALQAAGATCLFDMSNMGLVNAVARLPACSRFTYPIYAGPEHEPQLIADLEARAPAAVLSRADLFSYSIDGMTMAERYPALETRLHALYPQETCGAGVCIRTKGE